MKDTSAKKDKKNRDKTEEEAKLNYKFRRKKYEKSNSEDKTK